MASKKNRFKWLLFIFCLIAGSSYLFKDDSSPKFKTDSVHTEENIYVDSDGVEHKIETWPFSEVPTVLARFYEGKHATICGKIFQKAKTHKGAFINFGDRYPDHDFSIVIWGDIDKKDLPLNGQNLCVTGLVSEYNGKPQIKINSLHAQIYYKQD